MSLCEKCGCLPHIYECCDKKRCKGCYNHHKRKWPVHREPDKDIGISVIDALNYAREIKQKYDDDLQEAFDSVNNTNTELENRLSKIENDNAVLQNEVIMLQEKLKLMQTERHNNDDNDDKQQERDEPESKKKVGLLGQKNDLTERKNNTGAGLRTVTKIKRSTENKK
jgi:hypothetical protein